MLIQPRASLMLPNHRRTSARARMSLARKWRTLIARLCAYARMRALLMMCKRFIIGKNKRANVYLCLFSKQRIARERKHHTSQSVRTRVVD